jgi:NAD(P)-dependent dehydrogenase (short-subunit alcohol dehydrogenase family)
MDLELAGKRAIVSGASRGIGRAIADELSREGADVVITARGQAELERAASEIATAHGGSVTAIALDTGDAESVESGIDAAIATLGGVDVLVNCAADPLPVDGFQNLAELTEDAFWRDVNVKVLGYLRTARRVAPHMIDQGWGRIINISGTGARQTVSIVRSIRNVSVAAMTKNLADELGPHGINVTVVHPGGTRTERVVERWAEEGLTPEAIAASYTDINAIGRIVEPQEVAWVVAFLASPRSVSITGDAVTVAGGVKGFIYY